MKIMTLILTIFMTGMSAQALEYSALEKAADAFNEKCGTEFTTEDVVEEVELDSDWDYQSILVVFPAEGTVTVSVTKAEEADEWNYPTYQYQVIEVFCSVDI